MRDFAQMIRPFTPGTRLPERVGGEAPVYKVFACLYGERGQSINATIAPKDVKEINTGLITEEDIPGFFIFLSPASNLITRSVFPAAAVLPSSVFGVRPLHISLYNGGYEPVFIQNGQFIASVFPIENFVAREI